MSSQLQVSGEAKIRDIQGPVVANSGVITALDGAASQYVRGDGTLADFPTSSGGGSSVSYYLNSSVSQGTIGGVAYRQLSKTPISGAGTDITISSNGYVASYITDANDPSLLEVPAGNFNCEFYFSVNSNNHNPYVYAELYKYDGSTFTLLGSNQAIPEYLTNGTTLSAYYFAIPVATAALTITDRLAIRIFVNVDGRVVTLHTENNHLCQVVTTFSKGLTSLNNLTRQVQFLATGTSGTDFNISSSTATHTFNLPVASATNTGKLSSTDWSTFNNKQPAGNYVTLDTTQTISGLKTFSAASVNIAPTSGDGGILNLKRGAYTGGINDYTSLISQGDNFGIASLTSSSNRSILFDFASITSGILRTYTLPNASGTIALTSQLTGGTVTSVGLSSATSGVTIGSSPITTSGTITLAIATASGSQNGLLSSTDWTTFNNKYNLPSLTSGSVLFSNGSNIAQNNANFFWDNTNSFLGVGTNIPSAGVTSFSSTPAFQFKAAGVAPAMTFSNTLTSASLAAVFGLATSNNQFVFGTATGDFAIANQSTSAGAIVFGTGTTEKMRMTSAGTFSIGNTNSTYKLDVTGTGRFTDDLYADAGVFSLGLFTSDETKYVVPAGVSSLLTLNLSGALSGTSATFSTQLKVSNPTGSALDMLVLETGFNNPSGNKSIIWKDATSTLGRISVSYDAGTGSTMRFGSLYNGGYQTSDLLTIASTGAATFSSSVTAGVLSVIGGASSLFSSALTVKASGTNRALSIQSSTAKTSTASAPLLTLNSNETSTPQSLDFNYIGASAISNRYFSLQTSETGVAYGGNIVLQPDGGNVGIGTSSPNARLSLGTGTTSKLLVYDGGTIAQGGNGFFAGFAVDYPSGNDFGMFAHNNGALVFGKYTNNNDLNNVTERMRITSGGQVQIKQAGNTLNNDGLGLYNTSGNIWGILGGGDNNLYIGYNYAARGYFSSSTGVYINLSDKNKKKDFEQSTIGLNAILSLKPTLYRMKTDDTEGNKELGFIAQEVKEFIPQAFVESEDFIGLNYNAIVTTLVKAIQEQTQIIKDLEARIVSLESK